MDSQNERHEREIMTEFISLYVDLPCLWDIGSDVYKNRNQKTEAWDLMIEKLKEIDPQANIAAAKKKIEYMRSAFKREYKKVKESKRTGAGANDVHVPNLWYYNLLLPIFEKKDDQSRCGMDTLSSDEESRSSEPEKGRKKKRNALEMKKQMLIETAQELLQSDNSKEKQDKINSFGLYVGEQLDQMESFQRQVAEKLISDILFLGKTGNLHFESRIESAKSRNFAVSRSCSSDNFYTQQAPSYQIIHTPLPRHHNQTSPFPQHIQPSSSPQYIQPSSSPQHIQPSPSPQHIRPSPSPQHFRPSPSPQHIQPSPSPQHIQPSPSPQHIQPSPSPQHIQPSPSSQHSQPSPSSQHILPTPSPQHIQSSPSSQHSRPSSSSQYIQPSPSPYIQILTKGFQPAPSPHQIQPSLLPSSSSKQHFQTSSPDIQVSPPAQNHLLSTILQKQFTAHDENENIIQISIPSPTDAMPNNKNSLLYEGPASEIGDFLIFKKDK